MTWVVGATSACGYGAPAGYSGSVRIGFTLLESLAEAIRRSQAVTDRPHAGISRHFHAVVVRRGEMSTWNNDERIHYPDGSITEVRMPPVAQSYDEFERLAASGSSDAV